MKRAILIDAQNQKVSEVEIIGEGREELEEWYRLLKCKMVEVALILPNGDEILVDEEGWLKEGATEGKNGLFRVRDGQFYAGNGLVVGGPDREGEATSAKSSQLGIAAQVSWPNKAHH